MPKLILLLLMCMTFVLVGCSSLYFRDTKAEHKFIRATHAQFNTKLDPELEREMKRREEQERIQKLTPAQRSKEIADRDEIARLEAKADAAAIAANRTPASASPVVFRQTHVEAYNVQQDWQKSKAIVDEIDMDNGDE